jgi:hypothetical protein
MKLDFSPWYQAKFLDILDQKFICCKMARIGVLNPV